MTDQEKTTEQTALENERLKRMIKRVSKSAMGMLRAGGADEEPDQGMDFLPIQISSILMADRPLEDKLNDVLKRLGEYIDVSRVYIFENFDDNKKCRNTYEWVNQGVSVQKNNLIDLDYSEFPFWKKILEEKGSIIVSNIREQLPESCWEVLEKQEIKSVLAFSLRVQGRFWGFIGFDECSFEREWIPFEVNILKVTAQLISNAVENQIARADIESNIRLQELLLSISNLFITSDSFQDQLNNALGMMGEFFNVDRAYVFENSADTSFCSFLSEWCNTGVPSKKELFHVLNYNTDLSGWHATLLEKGSLCSAVPEQNDLLNNSLLYASEEISSIIVFPIKSQYHFWGIIGFDNYRDEKKWEPNKLNTLQTISGILAGAFERKQVNEENRRNHASILKINEQLKGKEEFLSHILRTVPVGIMIVKNKKITYINDRAVNIIGYSREELLGAPPSVMYDESGISEDKIQAFYEDIRRNGTGSMELTVTTKEGNPIAVQVTGAQASYDSNEDSFLMIGLDISEIKKAEQELLDSQNRIRTIIETTIDGIMICEKPDKISYINRAGTNLLGYEIEYLQDINLDEIFPDAEEKSRYLKAFEAIDANDEFKGDIKIKTSKGQILFLETSGTSVMLDNKKQYYFSLHDVTQRSRNEHALQQSEEKFRTLSENSKDHILRIDSTGKISYCNSSFLDEYGFKREDIIGHTLTDITDIPTEFKKGLWSKITDVLKSGIVANMELVIHYKGRYLVFDWTVTPESNISGEASSVLVVGRDFTRRKNAERELMIAKDKAESADKLKSAFLANMSHEIRTPLNAIVGFANLLKEDFIDNDEKEEYIKIINKSSDSLMMLINDIIDLARIESGLLNLEQNEVDINGMLHSLFTTFKQRARTEKGDKVSVILSIPQGYQSLQVISDENRLIQIFNNLLGNALKFTNNGFVEFGYTLKDDFIRFYVHDTGIGIVHEKHSIIFEQFRQADDAIAKKYGGTGLGLTICKRLVNAMGGEIGLISDPGEGAEFFFTIPLTKEEKKEEEKEEKTVEIKPEALRDIPSEKNYTWSDKMVLLVDDNSSVHLQLRKYLEKTGVTVISARTGNSARELLRKRNDISMVLMDIQMPDVNGLNFIQDIKNQGIKIPFIAQSTKEFLTNSEDILRAGYDEFVSKPIDKEELLSKMDKLLHQK